MINESFTGLRPYQLAAIMDIDEQVKAGHKQIILYCPTGGGKTEIAIGLMKRAALQEGKRVLFVVDRIDLVHQAARRMYKSGLHCGIIQGGNSQDEDAQVIAGSIQTMHRRKAKQQFDLIIVDEAHKATSRVYREFLAHQPAIVIGLTATPFTQGLGTLFSKLIKSSSVADLVERKYLVDCDIYAPSTPDLRGVNIVRGDYDQAALGNRVNTVQLVGDIVSTWRAMASNRRTVVFATNVAHSKHIQQQFLSAGIACEHVDAYTDREERDAIYARLNSGETRVLTNVEVCSTGWDVPAVECMILARPTQSITLYVQMIGRVLRPAPGKERALVLDHSGSCVRFGYPISIPVTHLDCRDIGERVKRPKSDDAPPPVVWECPKCHHINPMDSRTCQCGHERRYRTGVEISLGSLSKMDKQMQTMPLWAQDDLMQSVYSQLLTYRDEKGYQMGWVAYKFKEIFGFWPPKNLAKVSVPLTDVVRKFVRNKQINQIMRRKHGELASSNPGT